MTKLTTPQQRLLDRARFNAPKPLHVRGTDLRVAERLQRLGLVTLRIGGTGIPFKGHWWYEIQPTETSQNQS